MSEIERKYDIAEEAMRDLATEASVGPEENIRQLRALKEEIDMQLDSLRINVKENQ